MSKKNNKPVEEAKKEIKDAVEEIGKDTYDKISDDVMSAADELYKRLDTYMNIQTSNPKIKRNYDLAAELLKHRILKEEGIDITSFLGAALKTLGPVLLKVLLDVLKSMKK